jgi:hypothetical protein
MFHQATISRGELELLRRVAHVVRAGHISFSAAAIAYVEATVADDERKNTLCRPMPYGEALSTLPAVLSTELGNQAEWAQEPGLRDWARALSRARPRRQSTFSASSSSASGCWVPMSMLET